MPYDNFNSRSVFGEMQDQERAADQEAFMKQAALYGNIPVDYTGNINLANRPVVQNPDGSVSTTRSMSFNEDGKEVLIPTVSQNGTIMSPRQAIDEYHRTGQNFGLFNNVADANNMAQQIHNQQASGYGNAPAQAPTPTAVTQMVAQGNNVATRKPTAAEYEAGVINYLVNNRGYSYEDAQQLMAPRIHAYKVQEEAENKAMADNLINELSTMRIDDPAYRQKALQLLQLNPQMGGYMLKEGISPREQYVYDRNRRDKREDQVFNANMQFDNRKRLMDLQNAYTQQQMMNRVQQLMQYGDMDERTAWATVLGGGRGGRGTSAAGNAGVSSADYKRAVDGLKALDDEVAEGRLENPNFQLSPQKQQQYNMLAAVKQRGDNEFFARNGVAMPQQQRQRINVSDYNQLKPMLQALVQRNGGKFDKNIAMLVRKYAGLDPNNNNPNEYLNEVFKRDYDYSG